ncbi:MAG: TadE/TadG family type IV pilus assembly protein [Parcubacteria group bacterium]
MSQRRSILRFLADQTGAAAVEFALVSVVFLGLAVGTVDISRLLWEVSSCKAATRAATRYAVVNQPAAQVLVDFDAVATLNMYAGDPIPVGAVGAYTCTSSGCTCSGSGYCGSTALNTTAFDNIVSVMQARYAGIQAANVVVVYTPVGLGLAGNPYGPDVEPLVTVRLCQASDGDNCTPLQFAPGVLQAFGISPFDVPPVASSLSGEDLS